MAGDWIPMRIDLMEDPAVMEIAESLGVREEVVVGYCHAFWSWLSRQCHDGSVTGVTLAALGRRLNLPGFPEQLVEVGWLEYSDRGGKPLIVVPKFDRWLSQSAKQRALAAKRKQRERHDDVTQMSRSERDKNVTTVEKRREEDNKNTTCSSPEPDKPASGELSSFVFPTVGNGPKEWVLPLGKLEEYRESYPAVDVEVEIRSARQWCIDNPKNQKTARGMTRFLNAWFSRAQNRAPKQSAGPRNGSPSGPQKVLDLAEMKELGMSYDEYVAHLEGG